MKQKTYMLPKEKIDRGWHLVDAQGQILGRMASKIVKKLTGKHKVNYTPHIDNGDYVVVVNAEKIELSRNKAVKKVYRWHTGHPGGIKERTFKEMMNRDPQKVLYLAVKKMLPKNKLRKPRLSRLKIFAGAEHSYQQHFGKKKSDQKKKTANGGK